MSEQTSPRVGIIGGSGLGNELVAAGVGAPADIDTPFGKPSAPLMLGAWEGVPIAFLARHGIGHTIPPSAVPYRANIWALKAAGCRWVIASGAVGSLREEIAPRDLVLCDQAIDRTVHRASTFFDQPGAAVHVEFADPFCQQLRTLLLAAARNLDLRGAKVHDHGAYVCMEGPAFSTRVESRMHRQWGGDLIGMTALPEAKLAREAELSYALVALATDYDCWKPHDASLGKQELLKEIIGHMHAATDNALALIRAALPLLWARREEQWPAHRALELAIWTAPEHIPAATKKRLELLWRRYV
jgi:5'-methylthioadenosine phosphorylase